MILQRNAERRNKRTNKGVNTRNVPVFMKMKKLLSVFLSLVLLLSATVLPAVFAADEKFSFSEASGSPGDLVDMVLTIDIDYNFTYLSINIEYDSNALTLSSWDSSPSLEISVQDGKYLEFGNWGTTYTAGTYNITLTFLA